MSTLWTRWPALAVVVLVLASTSGCARSNVEPGESYEDVLWTDAGFYYLRSPSDDVSGVWFTSWDGESRVVLPERGAMGSCDPAYPHGLFRLPESSLGVTISCGGAADVRAHRVDATDGSVTSLGRWSEVEELADIGDRWVGAGVDRDRTEPCHETLERWTPDGGEPIALTVESHGETVPLGSSACPVAYAGGLRWSEPTGLLVFTVYEFGDASRDGPWPATSVVAWRPGEAARVLAGGIDATSAVLSPDGSRLYAAVRSGPDGPGLLCLDLVSGETTWLVAGESVGALAPSPDGTRFGYAVAGEGEFQIVDMTA